MIFIKNRLQDRRDFHAGQNQSLLSNFEVVFIDFWKTNEIVYMFLWKLVINKIPKEEILGENWLTSGNFLNIQISPRMIVQMENCAHFWNPGIFLVISIGDKWHKEQILSTVKFLLKIQIMNFIQFPALSWHYDPNFQVRLSV